MNSATRSPVRSSRSVVALVVGVVALLTAGVWVVANSARMGDASVQSTAFESWVEDAAAPLTEPGEADGVIPFGTTVFEDLPGVTNLEPELLAATEEASTVAQADGVHLFVSSGWRSEAHQEQLLQDAVGQYGSVEEAARWVATPPTSLHVSGDAVDIEGTGAADWLVANGAEFDLCQIYANEAWHFELVDGASVNGCPELLPDPTFDPRLNG